MKLFYTSIFLTSFFFLLFPIQLLPQQQSRQIKTQAFFPDLDGKIQTTLNYSPAGRNYSEEMKVNATFTLFPGFPLSSTYAIFSPKTGGIYCNMDADPEMEVVFAASQNLHVVNLDGTPVSGWPKAYASNNEIPWAPSYGDIDGDGAGELVVGIGGTVTGNVYAYKQNGTVCAGFPVASEKYTISPTLSDLNNDGKMEIIIGTRSGKVYIWKGDGTILTGWPKQMDRYVAASCSIGDINNDGAKEIVGQSRNLLYVWNLAGNVLPGFPFAIIDSVNGSNSYSATVIADIDNNGSKELIFASHSSITGQDGIVYVVRNDGTIYPGWPKFMSNWIYAAPSVYDVNGDGNLEIFVPEYGASGTPIFYLYGYTKDGVNLPNFPIGPLYGMANQVTIANLDDDAPMEIMIDQNIQVGENGHYAGFNLDGTVVSGFPLELQKNTSFQQPLLGDLNNDGIMDLVGTSFEFGGTYSTRCYVWSTGLTYSDSKIVNKMYQYNTGHDGFFGSTTIPVKLVTFNAEAENDDVLLSWKTATETNNRGFAIERNTVSGFEQIAFIEGKGTSASFQEYNFTDKNAGEGNHSYRLKQIDFNGSFSYSGIVEIYIGNPEKFQLLQNYPNPFNPSTKISYDLSKSSNVSLRIYDVLGNEVAVLVNSFQVSGKYQITFDAAELSSGMYLCSFISGDIVKSIKMNLIK